MVSSVSSSNAAIYQSALQSRSGSSGCSGSRDTQALQEKLFSKLDANGDGGIDKSELGDFMSYVGSSSGSTNATTDSSELFSKLDADGDGSVSKTEMADGAKALFDELRTQLMSAAASKASTATLETSSTSDASSTSATSSTDTSKQDELFAKMDANGDGSIDKDELGSFMSANPPPGPPPGGGPGGGQRGGLFSKIESLLDQYRSNSTSADTTIESETASTLSIAA
jgi:Ca2+-binding EF-hand superfamily protein